MEIKYVNEDGTMFGVTRFLGIGKRQPKVVYGDKAKALRENNNIDLDALSKALSIKKDVIEGIEATKRGMTEQVMAKYMDYFKVEKEYFFDTDLAVYILNDNGNVVKTYETSEECKKAFEFIKNEFLEGCKDDVKNFSMFIDFSKKA